VLRWCRGDSGGGRYTIVTMRLCVFFVFCMCMCVCVCICVFVCVFVSVCMWEFVLFVCVCGARLVAAMHE